VHVSILGVKQGIGQGFTMRSFIHTSNFSNKKSLNTCYLEGELITLKVKPHFLRKRPHPKIITFRRFSTATIAGKKLQMGEV